MDNTIMCPVCGARSPAGKRFCGECGSSLAAARPVPPPEAPPPAATGFDEERRPVTVLFADLVGFTALSERLDPEEVRELQAAYFGAMSGEIERFGGTIEKYAGDAILALFGAPVAHEDDPARAVRCALAMRRALEPIAAASRERWGTDLAIRIGVNTGEVVTGFWEAGSRRDWSVSGDVVNTASRLQTAAGAGGILIGAETAELAKAEIRVGRRRSLRLKGKAESVPAYPVLGLREQVAERWETERYRTPMVGRQAEIGRVLAAWKPAQRGEGQAIELVGEAGVGKSRLLVESVTRILAGGGAREVRARCLSYGQGIALWLIADLVRSLFSVREQDTASDVAERLPGAIRSLLRAQDVETQQVAVDVLGELLGLPAAASAVARAQPEVRRRSLIRSLDLVLEATTRETPAVVVLEDLHWIDPASREVLDQVVAGIPGIPVLALMSFRPGWEPPWAGAAWIERLEVEPLPKRDSELLMEAVIGGIEVSEELKRYVTERAAGNPLFVEELLRMLRGTGGLVERDGEAQLAEDAAERLPTTLTGIVLARLDGLNGQAREVARVASVIGRRFGIGLLADLVQAEPSTLEPALARLVDADLAFRGPAADSEYVFKHAIVRDAAYNTLLQRQRQELHAAAARAIAARYPTDEYVELIAYHFARTPLHAEAGTWLERAADRARDVYANELALGYYEQARQRLLEAGANERSLARVDEKHGVLLKIVNRFDDAFQVLERALATFHAVKDRDGELHALAQIVRVHLETGTAAEGIARLQPALDSLEHADVLPHPAVLAELEVVACHLYYREGMYRESQAAAKRAEELARAIGDSRILADAQYRRGWVEAAILGNSEEGLRVIEGAIPAAEASGDPDILQAVLVGMGTGLWSQGHLEKARATFERVLVVVERMGNLMRRAWVVAWCGFCSFYLGDWTSARTLLERAVELSGSIESYYAGFPLYWLGYLCLAEGRWEEAEPLLEQAIVHGERNGNLEVVPLANGWLTELRLLEGRPIDLPVLEKFTPLRNMSVLLMTPILAWAYLVTGDGRADAVAAAGVEAARKHSRVALVEALRVQGMILTARENWEEAEGALREAASLAREMPYPYGEARALYAYGVLQQRRGAPAEAVELLGRAREIFRALGARPDLERTEDTLAELAGTV
jgi:class 3 adenylate cyclase/tetratricopeptide (TPR) repeat protein